MNAPVSILIAALAPVILGWLLRKRSPQVRWEGHGLQLGYGPAFRNFPWVLLAGVAGLLMLIAINPPKRSPHDAWALAGFMFGFGSLIAVLSNEFRRIYVLDDQGIVLHSPWRRRPTPRLEWSQLESAHYAGAQQAIQLRFHNGEKLQLSQYLDGLNAAAALIAQVAGRDRLDAGLRATLDDLPS